MHSQYLQREHEAELELMRRHTNSLTDSNKQLNFKLECLEEFYFYNQEIPRITSDQEKENVRFYWISYLLLIIGFLSF